MPAAFSLSAQAILAEIQAWRRHPEVPPGLLRGLPPACPPGAPVAATLAPAQRELTGAGGEAAHQPEVITLTLADA